MQGSRPWAWAEDQLEEMMAKVVGEKPEQTELLQSCTFTKAEASHRCRSQS